MRASHWRERREQYLRERDPLSDFIREGFVEAPPLTVIQGGGKRDQQGPAKLRFVDSKPPPRPPAA
jgi:hypothetical protein